MVAVLQLSQQQTLPYPQDALLGSPSGTLSNDLGGMAGQRALLEASGSFSVEIMVVGVCKGGLVGDKVIVMGGLVGYL